MKAVQAKSVFRVDFGPPEPVPQTQPRGRIPRVARMLALAHKIDEMVRCGEYRDYAYAARSLGLTRARVTQITNLLLLAPEIQAQILGLEPVTSGRDPVTERQLRGLAAALPNIIDRLNEITQDVSTTLPEFIRPEQVEQWLNVVAGEIANLGGTVLETLITQSFGFVAVLIYLILVPVSVFFFLKDRERLMHSFLALLPKERPLLDKVGAEMNLPRT